MNIQELFESIQGSSPSLHHAAFIPMLTAKRRATDSELGDAILSTREKAKRRSGTKNGSSVNHPSKRLTTTNPITCLEDLTKATLPTRLNNLTTNTSCSPPEGAVALNRNSGRKSHAKENLKADHGAFSSAWAATRKPPKHLSRGYVPSEQDVVIGLETISSTAIFPGCTRGNIPTQNSTSTVLSCILGQPHIFNGQFYSLLQQSLPNYSLIKDHAIKCHKLVSAIVQTVTENGGHFLQVIADTSTDKERATELLFVEVLMPVAQDFTKRSLHQIWQQCKLSTGPPDSVCTTSQVAAKPDAVFGKLSTGIPLDQHEVQRQLDMRRVSSSTLSSKSSRSQAESTCSGGGQRNIQFPFVGATLSSTLGNLSGCLSHQEQQAWQLDTAGALLSSMDLLLLANLQEQQQREILILQQQERLLQESRQQHFNTDAFFRDLLILQVLQQVRGIDGNKADLRPVSNLEQALHGTSSINDLFKIKDSFKDQQDLTLTKESAQGRKYKDDLDAFIPSANPFLASSETPTIDAAVGMKPDHEANPCLLRVKFKRPRKEY